MTTAGTDSGDKRRDAAGLVRDTYALETRLTASLSGCVFKAVEKSTRVSVGLWISRWPLDDAQEGRFIQRAKRLGGASSQSELISFGLDSARYGWATFRTPSGRHILDGRLEQREAERRYLGCVRSVAQFHREGIPCGDISLEAFLLQAGGEPRFIGGLGNFASPEDVTSTRSTPELRELAVYLGPEQRDGEKETIQGDVFSLAIVAYRFFLGNPVTESFPEFSGGAHTLLPPIPGAPGWLQRVVMPILSGDVSTVPADADELMQLIIKSRQAEFEEDGAALEDGKKAARVVRSGPAPATSLGADPLWRSKPRTRRALWLALLCVVIAVAGIVVGAQRPRLPDSSWLSFGRSSQEDQQRKRNELALSDDPMAHEGLLRMLKDLSRPEERAAIISEVLVRSRRLGLLRASDLVRAWYATGEPKRLLEGDHPIALTMINPSLSDSARLTLGLQSYPQDKAEVTQLVAAVGLDRDTKDLYKPIFEKGAQDLGRVEDSADHSTKAIMLAVPVVRAIYFGDIFEASPELSKGDTEWLLQVLGTQGDPMVRRVATLALENGTYSGAKAVFADALRAGVSLSTRERRILVSCLEGNISVDTVSALVASYFPEAAQALFAIAYLSPDETVRRSAFDGVATKPLTDPVVRKVADFVRNKRSSQRDNYVRIVATAALSANLDQSEFNQGFTAPEPFAAVALRDKEFITILLRSGSPRVVSEILELVGAQLDVGTFLDLLSNPNKEVRVQGLQRLEGVNDATAITFIRQSYESEQDPDVRSEYQARFFTDRSQ